MLETYPRDELFQIDEDTLYRFALDILQLDERPRVRVLPRRDRFDRFVSILVYVPRDRYDSHTRALIGDYLATTYKGRVRAFYGNFGMFVRALAYIQANGPDGLRQTTEDAVLNANYIRKGLEGTYDLPYSTPTMHEVVFSDKLQAKKGVRTMDIAKRLIDYGFHPYTTAFPLIVPGALMIEPTESESKEELDLFVEAMKSIAEEVEEDPQTVVDAPHSTRVSRLDEAAAARKPVVRWKPPA